MLRPLSPATTSESLELVNDVMTGKALVELRKLSKGKGQQG